MIVIRTRMLTILQMHKMPNDQGRGTKASIESMIKVVGKKGTMIKMEKLIKISYKMSEVRRPGSK